MTEPNQYVTEVVVFDNLYDHDEGERTVIQIKRKIAFQKRVRDLYAETRGERLSARLEKIKSGSYYSLPEIFALLTTAIKNMESAHGTRRAVLLKKTKSAIDVYTAIPRALDILQKRMPVVLINTYLQIAHLRRDISENMEIFGARNVDEKVVRLLENLEEVLYKASEAMLGFWKSMPDVTLRLPFEISKDILSADVFESDPYRRYTISSMLPYWLDPRIMAMINEARQNMFQIPPLPIMTATELLRQQLHDGTAKCESGSGEGRGLTYYTLYV